MLNFDFSAFDRVASRMGTAADQIPFAISVALNKAAQTTENRLADETWAKHVQVRNRGFLRSALRIERSNRRNLRVAIFDSLGRANLGLHDKGGIAKPRNGRFAIPTKRVRKGAKGVVQSQRPSVLARKVVKKGLIFQKVGRGKNEKLQLMYKLQASNKIKADVPFHADFKRFMEDEITREFPKALAQAMAGRR